MWLLLFFISINNQHLCAQTISCILEDVGRVDWYYLYKLPKHYSLQRKAEDSSGLRYLHQSSSSSWQLSDRLINESTSTPGLTLNPVLNNQSLLVAAYNDESPGKVSIDVESGHTKGVLVTDGRTGFWLVHSVPLYPDLAAGEYDYPRTGHIYGQSYLCITLNASEIDAVGEQLVYNEPDFYFSQIPPLLKGKYPNLERALRSEWIQTGPFHNELRLRSGAGRQFVSFAKGRNFRKELYEDWVAPALRTDLYAETWRHGGSLASNCSLFNKVYNVEHIELKSEQISFKSNQDHSKWAVGAGWICVGDINRASHQLLRGGGTVCQNNTGIAYIYKKLVEKVESCSRK